jgi:Helix-turn-helix domain
VVHPEGHRPDRAAWRYDGVLNCRWKVSGSGCLCVCQLSRLSLLLVRLASVMATVIQSYRLALDPTPVQEAGLRSHCGAQRFAFNWGLARVKANLDQRKAEASYGLAAEEITPSMDWSAYSLRKGLEPGQAQGRAVVGGELERGVCVWSGESGDRARELEGLQGGEASWPHGAVSPVQGQAVGVVVSVHYWQLRPGRHRSQACQAAPHRCGAYLRVDPETGPACRAEHSPTMSWPGAWSRSTPRSCPR